MATVRLLGQQRNVPAFASLGRREPSLFVLDHASVSREHALLYWSGSSWVLRDLNSRNGTWLDGKRMGKKDEIVRRGQVISLGGADGQELVVVDDGPPRPFAVHAETGEEIGENDEGVIVTPEGSLWQDPAGAWFVQRGDVIAPAPQRLGAWALWVPEHRPGTVETLTRHLSDAQVRFEVRAHREIVRMVIRFPEEDALDFGEYEHHWPLYLLAMERRRSDAWMSADRLALRAAISRKTLDVYLGRCRRCVTLAHIIGGDGIYEVGTGERRFGLPGDRVEDVLVE
jgi:hypothetical protein